jgi:hypothetical protein
MNFDRHCFSPTLELKIIFASVQYVSAQIFKILILDLFKYKVIAQATIILYCGQDQRREMFRRLSVRAEKIPEFASSRKFNF